MSVYVFGWHENGSKTQVKNEYFGIIRLIGIMFLWRNKKLSSENLSYGDNLTRGIIFGGNIAICMSAAHTYVCMIDKFKSDSVNS